MAEVRPGVKLETRQYGDPATASTLVVWGHGLCNTLVGEDKERLWQGDIFNPKPEPPKNLST
jgi:hypothetical protein